VLETTPPPLARRLLDGERDLEGGLSPAAVVHGLAVIEDRGAHVVEHVVAARILTAAGQRDLAPALLAIDEHTLGRRAQIAARASPRPPAQKRALRPPAPPPASLDTP